MAWLAAAGQVATGLTNVLGQSAMNRRNRRHQWDMWHATNEYNTPKAQMSRFKDAGLNPHLIYGQGSAGNATPMQMPEQKMGDTSPFGRAAMDYVATKKQQSEIDNQETARRLMEADIIKRGMETLGVAANTDATKLDTSLKKDMYNTILEQAEANLKSTQVGTELTSVNIKKGEQELINLLEQLNLTKAQTKNVAQQTAESMQRVKNLVIDGKVKDAERRFKEVVADYAENGVNFNQGWQDQLFKALGGIIGLGPDGIDVEKIKKNLEAFWEGGVDLTDFFINEAWKIILSSIKSKFLP